MASKTGKTVDALIFEAQLNDAPLSQRAAHWSRQRFVIHFDADIAGLEKLVGTALKTAAHGNRLFGTTSPIDVSAQGFSKSDVAMWRRHPGYHVPWRKQDLNVEEVMREADSLLAVMSRKSATAAAKAKAVTRLRSLTRIAAEVATGAGPLSTDIPGEIDYRTGIVRQAMAQSVTRSVGEALQRAEGKIPYPHVPRGYVYASTGKRAGQPTSATWQGWTSAEYMRKRGIITEAKFETREQKGRSAAIWQARERAEKQLYDRFGSGIAEKVKQQQAWKDLWPDREKKITKKQVAEATRLAAKIESASDKELVRGTEAWNATLAEAVARQKRQEAIKRAERPIPRSIGDLVKRRFGEAYEGAKERYEQYGKAGWGVGGLMLRGKMAMGGIGGDFAAISRTMIRGVRDMLTGLRVVIGNIARHMRNLGRRVVTMGTGLVREIIRLPRTIFRSFTMIRHAVWNLTFMMGLLAGAAYSGAKFMAPAAKVETWGKQLSMLEGLQRGYTGTRALVVGRPAAERKISWVREEATKMRATVPEAIEAARLMTAQRMWSKDRFKLFADMQTAMDVPLQRIIMPFVYLRNKRYGQFLRSMARFPGINQTTIEREMKTMGFSTAGFVTPRARRPEFFAGVESASLRILQRQFNGITGAIADTFEVAISNLSDAWFNMRAEIGKSALFPSKLLLSDVRGGMRAAGQRYGGMDFSGLFGMLRRIVGFGTRVLTAESPWKALKGEIWKSLTEKGGIGEAMKLTVANIARNLPSMLKGVWTSLAEVLDAGAVKLAGIFGTLPHYWDRLKLTLTMTFGDILETLGGKISGAKGLGKYLGPLGTFMLGELGSTVTGMGTGLRLRGMTMAAEKGWIPAADARRAAEATLHSPDIASWWNAGMPAVKGFDRPEVKYGMFRRARQGMSAQEIVNDRRSYGRLRESLVQAIQQRKYPEAAQLWVRLAEKELKYTKWGSKTPVQLPQFAVDYSQSKLAARLERAHALSLQGQYAQYQMGDLVFRDPTTGKTIKESITESIPEYDWKRFGQEGAPFADWMKGDKNGRNIWREQGILAAAISSRPKLGRGIWYDLMRGRAPGAIFADVQKRDVAVNEWLDKTLQSTGFGKSKFFTETLIPGLMKLSEMPTPAGQRAAAGEALKFAGVFEWGAEYQAALKSGDKKRIARAKRGFAMAQERATIFASQRAKLDTDQINARLQESYAREAAASGSVPESMAGNTAPGAGGNVPTGTGGVDMSPVTTTIVRTSGDLLHEQKTASAQLREVVERLNQVVALLA